MNEAAREDAAETASEDKGGVDVESAGERVETREYGDRGKGAGEEGGGVRD